MYVCKVTAVNILRHLCVGAFVNNMNRRAVSLGQFSFLLVSYNTLFMVRVLAKPRQKQKCYVFCFISVSGLNADERCCVTTNV